MPQLSEHQSDDSIKMLLIGDSGSGKSGALASLAAVGYKLRIIDVDNGLDILYSTLKKFAPAALQNVVYETITNKVKGVNGRIVARGNPDAWNKAMNLLTHWKVGTAGSPATPAANGLPAKAAVPPSEGFYDLGKLDTWGKDCVLVIDSGTFLAQMAMDSVLFLNGRYGGKVEIQDYMEAMRLIEGLLTLLYSPEIKCNVIFTSHIAYLGDEGFIKGFPATIGQKLSPKVGRYFNNCLQVATKGSGAQMKKVIKTVSQANIELKNSNPYSLPPEIEFSGITGGLATVFQTILGEPPNKWPAPSPSSTTPASAKV